MQSTGQGRFCCRFFSRGTRCSCFFRTLHAAAHELARAERVCACSAWGRALISLANSMILSAVIGCRATGSNFDPKGGNAASSHAAPMLARLRLPLSVQRSPCGLQSLVRRAHWRMASARPCLFLCPTLPSSTESAAGCRTLSLMDVCQSMGFDVHCATSARTPVDKAAALATRGVSVERVRGNHASFDAFVQRLDPALVVFDRFFTEEMFSWRVRRACPAAALVLDMQDIHSLRLQRQAAVARSWTGSVADVMRLELDMADATVSRELASALRSDLVLAVSPEEQRRMQQWGVPAGKLGVAPFFLNPASAAVPALTAQQQRTGFVFIGNMLHAPNADAVQWLRHEVWGEVRRCFTSHGAHPPDMHVYGANVTHAVQALHAPDIGFRVCGHAADQFATLQQHRVQLAPLRFGAGIKGKIADAWLCNTPTCTTSVGAEGMLASDRALPWGGRVADDAPALAVAAVQLYTNAQAWASAVHAGRALLRELYDERTWAGSLTATLLGLLDALADVRRRDGLGAMVWQQQLRSTEFQSRCIELKEALRTCDDPAVERPLAP